MRQDKDVTLGLAMIVRNEAPVIERCLRSVLPHIDYAVIVDTGSTDDTMSIAQRVLEGVPAHFGAMPWVDFGTNRTQLLGLAQGKTDWILCLDADMTLEGVGRFPVTSAGLVRYTGALDYAQALLLQGDMAWRYVGRTHEYVVTDDPRYTVGPAPGWSVTHHGDGTNRADKASRDITLLLEDADAGDVRAMFYLAQSFQDLDMRPEAMRWYAKRAEAGGFAEEAFIARMRCGLLAEADEHAVAELAEATQMRPGRAEPWYYLTKRFQSMQQWDAARAAAESGLAVSYPIHDTLFIERWIYAWGLLLERGVSAYYAGDPGRLKADMLTLDVNLPPDVTMQVRANLEYV